MTDTLGVFVLEMAPQAAMVHISFIGYEPYITEVHGSDMGTIRMVPDSEMLSKAVVKGYLPKTVIKGDAFVTPVENSVLAEAGSANDVLEKRERYTCLHELSFNHNGKSRLFSFSAIK